MGAVSISASAFPLDRVLERLAEAEVDTLCPAEQERFIHREAPVLGVPEDYLRLALEVALRQPGVDAVTAPYPAVSCPIASDEDVEPESDVSAWRRVDRLHLAS